MKSFFTILTLILGSFLFSQQMELSPEVVDFGSVAKGKDAKVKVLIKNVGKAPLILTNVKSSCDCTVPSWPKDPIMPGKTASMVFEYDSKKVGTFNKVVEVFSNDVKASRKVVRVKGNIY